MRDLRAYLVLVIVGLTSSSIMCAQTASQSGQATDHKGQIPPICQGEGRFNCASPTVKGQTVDTEPGTDAWVRTPTRRQAGSKPGPAPRHDISGNWRADGVDKFGYRGPGIFGAG